MFTNRFFIPFVTIGVVVLIAMRSIGLAVSPRIEASGNFSMAPTTSHSITEDKFNETIDLSTALTYTGALESTSTLHGTLTVRRDGSTTFIGMETFTGLVNGTPGTLTFKVVGSSDPYQTMQLTNTITSGTGELISLRGVISHGSLESSYTTQIDYE